MNLTLYLTKLKSYNVIKLKFNEFLKLLDSIVLAKLTTNILLVHKKLNLVKFNTFLELRKFNFFKLF